MSNHQNPTSSHTLVALQGTVERVTFHSEESGFCVLRVKVKGHHDLITVVGTAASIGAGEYVDCLGQWHNDKKHGLQFKSKQLKTVSPQNSEGIEKYLASGMIRGIGPYFAKQLIKAFGEKVFHVFDHEPHRLLELSGIGEIRQKNVLAAWSEQKSIREIMVFLQSHGVGTARAVRIYKKYGDRAIVIVKENPYRLALDIYGIGFKTADDLAQKLGIPKDSIFRARAGLHHVLHEIGEDGHCAAFYEDLIQNAITLLEISEEIIKEAIRLELLDSQLVEEKTEIKKLIYTAPMHRAESMCAKHLIRLLKGTLPWGEINTDKAIPWVEQITHLQLAPSQKSALATLLRHKISIITGGPGVGKTTIIRCVLKILQAKKLAIALAAPTGRAAKRLTETSNMQAKTIHRLLEFDPKTYAFKFNSDNTLAYDVIIIDESSMLDILLMFNLLKAIPNNAAVIFVGDVDQLPSVGAGAVLADMISSDVIPTVRLTEIFRQAANSKIIMNAHRINEGQMLLPNEDNPQNDFFTSYMQQPEEINEKLIQLVSERIPRHLQCDPLKDIQVLTPMNKGGMGAISLNIALQKTLNGDAEPKITRFGTTFAPGDKVIQTVNNYDKEVFNGDIGYINQINVEESNLQILFDNRLVEYQFHELDEINLAYAISIHKSQGSEFPVVILPVTMQHYMLLARNLLYTGVTRGKKLVMIIGQQKAVAIAIKNNSSVKRITKLKEWLIEMKQNTTAPTPVDATP